MYDEGRNETITEMSRSRARLPDQELRPPIQRFQATLVAGEVRKESGIGDMRCVWVASCSAAVGVFLIAFGDDGVEIPLPAANGLNGLGLFIRLPSGVRRFQVRNSGVGGGSILIFYSADPSFYVVSTAIVA